MLKIIQFWCSWQGQGHLPLEHVASSSSLPDIPIQGSWSCIFLNKWGLYHTRIEDARLAGLLLFLNVFFTLKVIIFYLADIHEVLDLICYTLDCKPDSGKQNRFMLFCLNSTLFWAIPYYNGETFWIAMLVFHIKARRTSVLVLFFRQSLSTEFNLLKFCSILSSFLKTDQFQDSKF